MSSEFWLKSEQVERLRPHFSKVRDKPRVDDRRVQSGMLHMLRNRLRWQDVSSVYGPPKTLYSRFVRWSRLGVFAHIFRDLAQPHTDGHVPPPSNRKLYKKRSHIKNALPG